ncbi:MAG: CBS domain-containing protein [Spirochaetota bacterium]
MRRVQELAYRLEVSFATERDPLTVSPDTMMSELRGILRSHKRTAAPVVRDGALLGIVSVEDYINWLSSGAPDKPVSACMSTDLVTLYQDDLLVEAVKKFEKYRFYEFPVLDRATGAMTGIITKSDMISGLLRALVMESRTLEKEGYRSASCFMGEVCADELSIHLLFRVQGEDIRKGGAVASRLKKNLMALGMHPDTLRRVSVAVYEAEMNLIIYGGGGEIEVDITLDAVHIQVIDRGPGIPDIQKALTPGFSTAPDWIKELGFGAGMGLTNIQSCSERFSIDSTVGAGTTLRMRIPQETARVPQEQST